MYDTTYRSNQHHHAERMLHELQRPRQSSIVRTSKMTMKTATSNLTPYVVSMALCGRLCRGNGGGNLNEQQGPSRVAPGGRPLLLERGGNRGTTE